MIERGRGKQDDRPDETGSRTCRQGGKKRLSREGEGREREREIFQRRMVCKHVRVTLFPSLTRMSDSLKFGSFQILNVSGNPILRIVFVGLSPSNLRLFASARPALHPRPHCSFGPILRSPPTPSILIPLFSILSLPLVLFHSYCYLSYSAQRLVLVVININSRLTLSSSRLQPR